MAKLDLTGAGRYPPLDTLTPEQLFDLGITLARRMPHLRVRAPAGDLPDEAVTLDGKLLSKRGVEVF